jgi:tRNA(Ile)-lysidine synthase
VPGVNNSAPIADKEVSAAFSQTLGDGSLLLAVSGGSDSMALMYLAAKWRKAGVKVVTVDHGLRREAGDEADFVVEQAAKLGLEAIKLKWAGPYPSTGISAAAREARYALMADVCRDHDAALVSAHTQEDQAETMLMALARGSGVDGLSAMQPASTMNGITLLRPLLGFSRDRLRATLREAGVGWVEDPTNLDEKYERVRVRKALAVLDELGVGNADIARSARRLSRARAALDAVADDAVRRCVVHEPAGFARILLEPFAALPEEIRLRVVLSVARSYGGAVEQSLSGAEALLAWIADGEGAARTFAGCRFARRSKELLVGREETRVAEPAIKLEPGSDIACWDGRYAVSLGCAGGPVTLCAVRDAPTASLPCRPSEVPAFVWNGLPVAIDGSGQAHLPGNLTAVAEKLKQNVVFSQIHVAGAQLS